MNEKENKRKWAVRILFASVIIMLFTASRFYRPMVVVSGSMLPAIEINSMLLMKYCDTEDAEIGDIVFYYDEKQDINIVHRVIEKSDNADGGSVLTVKGDANPVADYTPVTDENIIGKVVGIYNGAVPFVNIFIENTVVNKKRIVILIVAATAVLTLLQNAVDWLFKN